MEKLTALPGVGRKTANVVLGHALGVPGLPVDRHVLRVSNRIGIAEGDDPVAVEAQLCEALPSEKWTLASDVQILHGRRICRPKPLCDQCSVRDDCDYFRTVVDPAVARGGPVARRGSGKAGTRTAVTTSANGSVERALSGRPREADKPRATKTNTTRARNDTRGVQTARR